MNLQAAADIEAAESADIRYEVVNGEVVELPDMGVFETHLASRLLQFLGLFAETNKLGRTEAEMLFLLDRVTNLRRRPDVAFVSYERWPRSRRVPRAVAWDVVPNLTVEVVSETNKAEEILAKVREYFDAGVERVWVVFPNEQQVYVYHSTTETRMLTLKDTLTDEHVFPGFFLSLAKLFEVEEDA